MIATVPVFNLYGEHRAWPTPDLVHCESIEVRSRLHDWHIRPHQHTGLFQILYVRQGSAQVQIDGRHDVLQAGQVLLVPQGCVHGFDFEQETLGLVLTLAQPLLNKLAVSLDGSTDAFSRPRRTHGQDEATSLTVTPIGASFDAFDREYHGDAPHRTAAMEALLTTILVWVLRHLAASAPAHPVEMRRAVRHFMRFGDLLDVHFRDHRPVGFYAAGLGVTAAHLNVVCREIGGRSALAIMHERLLVEAKRSLVYTAMQIGEISDALGFSEPAYFTRFYKRATGMAPLAFRAAAVASH
ncbi:MAG: helix-turn-helix domain-containing protein [Herminiimonas sp.]|nr:helix-turn-helix domain-containing protein [Herminiimonas sp.]